MTRKKFNIKEVIEEMTENEKMAVVNWYAGTFNRIEDVPIKEVEFYLREVSSE